MTRHSLRSLLRRSSDDVLREVAAAWIGSDGAGARTGRAELIAAIAGVMEDERHVLPRLSGLPRKLQDLLETFFSSPQRVQLVADLFASLTKSFKSRFDLEACLHALQREGFLLPAQDPRWTESNSTGYAVPAELWSCVQDYRQRTRSALRDMLTLQGYLEARFFRGRQADGARSDQPGNGVTRGAEHARKIYKLYAMDASIATRRAKLPPAIAAVFEASLLQHGGLSNFADLQQEIDGHDVPDLELCKKCLEEAMLGTAGALQVARFGIQPIEQGLVIFHEVALAELRRHAAANPPPAGDVLSCGGNLATNVGRFLKELQNSKVLFTADGELFKASRKRIAGLLLPVPGGMLPAEQQLELLYRFCLHRRFIDRRGERSLRPTPQGIEFDRAPLAEQLKLLLAHFVEDRSLPGEAFHQVRLRRVLLRLLRRAEPMAWQEIAFLPFLARNAYLGQLDGLQAEEYFAARFQGGGYTPTETLQQMCWNLLQWVKRRLFPLGIVDLGFRDGRPIALRLSQLGADLLDTEPAGRVGGTRSSVIVNPDFEVLLFPGDDVHSAVHAFDRFSRRLKSDHVHQFRLERATVQAGIEDGLTLAEILRELTDRARVPVPQNVLYSLEEWAAGSGGR